jgi:pyridoxamine 5'-phosphate oxidase
MLNDDQNVKNIIGKIRRDYASDRLNKKTARKNPFEQFELWLAEAIEKQLREPNAMVLSTASADGKPSSRVVLLRGFENEGFTFYTNYESRKGKEVRENPRAALLFYWAEIEKQVRVEGVIAKTDEENSNAYFASRPRESQIGAWASPQSSVIENRRFIEEKFAELNEQSEGKEIARPPDWGGYILKPEVLEFWQGRASRLHDRLRYSKDESGWKIERLAP